MSDITRNFHENQIWILISSSHKMQNKVGMKGARSRSSFIKQEHKRPNEEDPFGEFDAHLSTATSPAITWLIYMLIGQGICDIKYSEGIGRSG